MAKRPPTPPPPRPALRAATRRLPLFLAALVAAPLPAADLVGRVTVPPVTRRAEAATKGAYGSRLAADPGQERAALSEAENVVVFIKQKVPGSYAPAARAPEMAQVGAAFLPRVLPVLAGTTVSFPNQDPIYHNIFSLSKTANFNLGRFPQGQTKTHRFDRPGMVRVNCDIHADMLGYILVLPHPFYAKPGADGRFRIPGVPPGRYHLVAWHDTLSPQVRQVGVPAAGELTVDFEF